jgi:hypothetical protein
MKINEDRCIIVDWKFGKRKEDFTQLRLFVAFVSIFQPQIKHFTVGFYWANQRKFTWLKVERSEVIEVWNELLPRIARLEHAIQTTDFPATESGLCKNYCPVFSCPHNGRQA